MQHNYQRGRKLEERSNLIFEFPTEESGEPTRFSMPFFENPIISEAQNANLVDYSPIGRAGSLYTYTGAQSRQITVKANFTLDHILGYYSGFAKFFTFYKVRSEDEIRQKFIDGGGQITSLNRSILDEATKARKSFIGYLLDDEGVLEEDVESLLTGVELTKSDKVISAINFWVKLIRSSVINNATNPVLGPPIVRLNHGILYNSIPCVCESYKISFDQKAGLDLNTLLPRVINVTLVLNEIRMGNLDKFTPFSTTELVTTDSLVGWESLITTWYEEDLE